MPTNPQSNSRFITRLPREVRDAIYLEVWRSYGLRQHIVSHWEWEGSEPIGAHFCRWPCTTEYEVEDKLQEEIDLYRIENNIPAGEGIPHVTFQERLMTPWLNHWRCSEAIEEDYGEEATFMDCTSGVPCWKKYHNRSKYTPPPPPKPRGRMDRLWDKAKKTGHRLSLPADVAVVSEECLKSLYESTTFIFTDALAWQTFVGFCEPHPRMKWPSKGIPPKAFLKYAKRIELSLSPGFPYDIPCSAPHMSAHPESLHNPYDFHWLHLDRFQNLQSIKMWIAARCTTVYYIDKYIHLGMLDCPKINDFDAQELKDALLSFGNIQEFVLSTPLHANIEPEDGYVEGITHNPTHQVWKRGTGDFHHPNLIRTYRGLTRQGWVEMGSQRYSWGVEQNSNVPSANTVLGKFNSISLIGA
ncbi:hypothetical protein FDECE_17138 [Fusarium decemcellulare]|nr:hypothetical protein FDECE_17138 [Fusarium decemcellulare]